MADHTAETGQEAERLTRADVAPATLTALESVARGFDLTTGLALVELAYDNGAFTHAYLKRKVTLRQLAEFEPVFREASSSEEPMPSATMIRAE